jgi:amidase
VFAPGIVGVLPSAADVAPPIASSGPEVNAFRLRTMQVTCIAGHARLPQVSIPLATAQGLPFGVGLIGPPGSDLALLALAEELAGSGEIPVLSPSS